MGLFDNGIGGFVSGLFGSTNKSKAQGYNVNPNAYNYGGSPNGAQNAVNQYQAKANAALTRQGAQIDYSQANQDRALQMQARQGQGVVAQSALARALGQTPSIAQQQADRQMGQATSAQASMAASARGAGALANAQRTAANNVANTQANISGQAQINAGNERLAAEQNAGNLFGQMRGGDLGSQGQSAQQAQAQAGFNDAQLGRNDQTQQAYDQMAGNVQSQQLAARMNQQAQASSNALGAQGINAGVGGQNAAMNQQNGMNVLGMAQSAAGGAATAFGGKATGGHTAAGTPYLVGENGPELVVPQHNAYVIPHDQTMAALHGQPASVVSSLFRRGDQAAPGHSLSSVLGDARCMGGYMGARADGGPMISERDAVGAGMIAPPSATPGFSPVQSTWGGTPAPDVDQQQRDVLADQQARMQPLDDASKKIAEAQAGHASAAARIQSTIDEIDAKDKDAIWSADYKARHNQSTTDEEEGAAAEGRYRQSLDRKAARAKAGQPAPKPTLSSILGDMGAKTQDQAKQLDVSYHGSGGGYAPPQLIPIIGTRAMGGPMSAPAAPSLEVLGPGGGMNVLGSEKAMSDFATQYGRQGGASPMAYGGAREEGGPVLGPSQKAAEDVTRRSQNMGTDLTNMGAPLSQIAPGLSFVLGANGLAAHAAAAAMRADDAAERDRIKAAQDEQVAQDAERAKMNAAERNASAPAPAATGASTPLARPDDRQKSRLGFLLSYLMGPERGR